MKIISHPTIRTGSHSFIVPSYIRVFSLNSTIIVDHFGCEDYLSPSSPREESLIHYATLLYRSCTHQYGVNLRPTAKRDVSPRVDNLTGKTISHPAVCVWNHSSTMLHCYIVHIDVNPGCEFPIYLRSTAKRDMCPRINHLAVCEDYLSPSKLRWVSLVYCAVLKYCACPH